MLDRPDAERVTAADAPYYEELVRKEQLQVDSQRVRTYFAFDKVRTGLLDVTARLFGLRYDEVDTSEVEADPEKAVRSAVASVADGGTVVVFSTYTAMWALHAILLRIGAATT